MQKGLIFSNQLALFGDPDIIGYSNGNMYVKEIERDKACKTIIKHHYSHKIYAASFIHLGVYDKDDKFVGVLQYGSAMNPASGGSVVEGTEIDNFLELNRMWLDDCAGRNSESQAISCSITYIKHRYPKVNGFSRSQTSVAIASASSIKHVVSTTTANILTSSGIWMVSPITTST